MDNSFPTTGLTEFQTFVLDLIVPFFETEKEINLYDLVKNALSHKDLTSNQEFLISETYEAIRLYMLSNGFAVELRERIPFIITDKGAHKKEIKAL